MKVLVRRWAGTAISVLLLLGVLWRLGSGPFVDGVDQIDLRALLATAALVFVTTLCYAWRWRIVARGLGLQLPFLTAVSGYYRAVFLNLTLPSGIAGDVYRGISHGRAQHDVSRALRAVVWERAAGQVMQILVTIAVLLVLPSPARSAMPFVALAVALAAVVGVVVAGRAGAGGTQPSRWTRIRDAVVTDIHDGVLRRSALPGILLASAVIVVGHALMFVIAARTAGVTVSVARLLPLAMLALMAMVLPSIAGWGPREAVTAWVFAAAGIGADRGAASAVTYGVLVLAANLPGAIVLLADWLPVGRSRERRPAVTRAGGRLGRSA